MTGIGAVSLMRVVAASRYASVWIGMTVLLGALLPLAAARATDMDTLLGRLPRAYIGAFSWDDGLTEQHVTIKLDSVRALSDAKAEAVGCGVYEIRRAVVRLKVRMFIRLSDLRIELWEQSPQGDAPFETAGSHRGNLSDDLQRIEAQWTSDGSGRRGHLHLHAAQLAICEPALSL